MHLGRDLSGSTGRGRISGGEERYVIVSVLSL